MNASRDQNFKPTLIVALNSDGKTIQTVQVNPATHALSTANGTTGTNYGPQNAPRDANNVPVLVGVSSSDFITPVVVYGDINGNMLVKST